MGTSDTCDYYAVCHPSSSQTVTRGRADDNGECYPETSNKIASNARPKRRVLAELSSTVQRHPPGLLMYGNSLGQAIWQQYAVVHVGLTGCSSSTDLLCVYAAAPRCRRCSKC
eukprot:5109509-Amphidinium_carterae.2